MHIAIFKTGTATRYGREVLGDYDGMVTALLAKPGEVWEVFDVEHGMFPAGLAGFDGVVVTGSVFSVNDPEPWINRLAEMLAEAYAMEIPLLGICFGAQMIARALGGAVAPNPKGVEIGLVELQLMPGAKALPGLGSAPRPLRVLQTHSDMVATLPPGAVLLASSVNTAVEMFHLGPRVLGLQGHPEMDNQEVEIILRKRPGLPEEAAAKSMASLDGRPDNGFFGKFLRGFLQSGSLTGVA